MLGITGRPGCPAAWRTLIAPLSVAAHRYPSVPGKAVAVISTDLARKQVVYDDAAVTSDRLPTAREIFDLHPRGYGPEKMRQPFILDPHEGPLRISRLSRDRCCRLRKRSELNQSEAASPPGGSSARSASADVAKHARPPGRDFIRAPMIG